MSEGWFCLHRGWRDNPLFSGEYSRADAWVWLIENACWKASRSRIKGETIELARGELTFSQRFLADKWGWSKSRVDRFISDLRGEGMIETRSKNGASAGHSAGQGQSIISICNYEKYQDISNPQRGNDEAASGATSGQRRGEEEQGNQETRDIPSANADGRSAPDASALDLAKTIFRSGVIILKAGGQDERQARSTIGRWKKTYSDGVVLAVLARCQIAQPEAPVEWIAKALQAEQQRAAGQAPEPINPRPQRAAVSEIGAKIAARRQAEREEHQQRIAIGGR
jgi:hypothetical protein